MRYLSVAWLLPLLLFSQSAEAARISFASDNCGTPPLLGLQFQVLAPGNIVTGSTVACPDAAVGTIVDSEGASLYGDITSIGFSIVPPNPVDIEVAFPVGRTEGSENYLDFGQGQVFLGVTSSFVINDDDSAIEALMFDCSPAFGTSDGPVLCRDLKIFVQGFEVGTTFRVTSVNGVSVPEPATLTLLAFGLAAAAVRRRRVIAGKWASPPGP